MLVEDEFEDRELTGPLEALRAAGATVTIVGPTAGAQFTRQARRGRRHVGSRRRRGADEGLRRAGDSRRPRARQDAACATRWSTSRATRWRPASRSRRSATDRSCSSPPTRCAAARSPAGRRSRSTSRTPAACYVDKPVVEDGNLITSRKPDDVPVFSEAIIRALARRDQPAETAEDRRHVCVLAISRSAASRARRGAAGTSSGRPRRRRA